MWISLCLNVDPVARKVLQLLYRNKYICYIFTNITVHLKSTGFPHPHPLNMEYNHVAHPVFLKAHTTFQQIFLPLY